MTASSYYRVREQNPAELSADERAARFFFLNRLCFNGVYRTNQAGQFNVPMGTRVGAIPNIDEIVAFSRLLKSASLLSCDFGDLVEDSRRGDFIYLDPPYCSVSGRNRGEYGVDSFQLPDIDRLSTLLHAADRRGAKILLSYADTREVRMAFHGWHAVELRVARSVAGFVRARGIADELLLSNYAHPKRS